MRPARRARSAAARGPRPGLAAVVVTALLTASLGGGALVAATDGMGLQVVPVSTQHWVGRNDVLLEVFDAAGVALAATGVPLSLTITAPDGTGLRAAPVIERFATYGRRLYRARVPLGVTGRWELRAVAEDGSARAGSAWLDVSADLGTPPLGSAVPGGATPTLRDAGSLLRAISSDPEPLGAFYVWSLDEALANGQPLVFVVDSYAYRPNAACGGALGVLHEIFIEYPGLTVVHAEPWLMRFREGQLTLDPPEGPAVLAEWSRAWGVREPPWVFVVDTAGHLHAKFTGVLGTDELRAALASVSSRQPPG